MTSWGISGRAGQRTALVLAAALTVALAISLGNIAESSAGGSHAVAAKKKCKKKGKKSAVAAKKCKKKKKTAGTPVVAPPSVTPPGPTLRGELAWAGDADLDLYVWDEFGNLAYYDGNDIPNSETTSNSPSPEQFFDLASPSTREFTYGVCVYDDEGEANTTYTLNAPGGPAPFSDTDVVGGTGDWVLYVGPFDPDPGDTGFWCDTTDDI